MWWWPNGRLALLLLVVATPGIAPTKIPSFAGPYMAYTKRFYVCDGSYPWPVYIRATHFNPNRPHELQRLTGNLTVGNETNGINDNYWAQVVMDTRSNNQWKENAFVFKFMDKACTALRTHIPDVYRVIFEGQARQGRCFLPPRPYRFVDEPVEWVFPSFPIMPYGEYRFRLFGGPNLNSKRLTVFCLMVECVIIPKV